MTIETYLIVLIVINFILLSPFLFINFSVTYQKYQFNNSIFYAQYALGYLLSIIGKIRIGKTSLLSGLSHLFQIVIINKNQETIDDIQKIFYFIDFNDFDNILFTEFLNDNNDFNDLTNIILNLYEFNGDHLVYDFLSFKKVKQYIYDYIEAFHTLNIRQQYVYSKTFIYSHITNKANLKYNLEWTKIKEAYKNKRYGIYDNFVELIDESTDDLGAGNNFDDIKDETGAKEYRRKYGHLHREKNYFITTKQDSTDEVKRFRNLTQSNIEIIEKVNIVGSFKMLNYLLNKLKGIPDTVNNIRFNIIAVFKGLIEDEKRLPYLNRKNKSTQFGKKFQNKIYYIQKFLFSQSYCSFKTNIYLNEQDVGKENSKNKIYYEPFNFVIPLRYCFGSFNTHQFQYIQDELINNSTLKLDDLDKSIMFKSIDETYF